MIIIYMNKNDSLRRAITCAINIDMLHYELFLFFTIRNYIHDSIYNKLFMAFVLK